MCKGWSNNFFFRTYFVLKMLCFFNIVYIFFGCILIKTSINKYGLSLQPCWNNKSNGGLLHSNVSIKTLYSVLSWSTFGSDYSLKSSWVWRNKLCTLEFRDFLPFFSADPLTLQRRMADQSPSPCHWKAPPQHDAATTMFHCWDRIGKVTSAAWLPPDMTFRLEAK